MQVNMLEAKNRLSSLIVAAEQGEEILIARNGVPVARIVPYVSLRVNPPGAWKGLVPYSTDWRSAATERAIERLFHGEDDASAAEYAVCAGLRDGLSRRFDAGNESLSRFQFLRFSQSLLYLTYLILPAYCQKHLAPCRQQQALIFHCLSKRYFELAVAPTTGWVEEEQAECR